MQKSFKDTVLLPKTDFPMKADLARREPMFLERWENEKLYEKILAARSKNPKFIFHDGPPYANGHIHIGHFMNKTLKDFVVKSKTMVGFQVQFVPGWDCHGLPIEHQVTKSLGPKARGMSPVELRQECRKYAEKYVDIQRADFKRMGVFGTWLNPYRTMDFVYQAQITREFAKLVENGYVFRNRKAIHWCISCETALAEAEIEYANHKSPSIYVKYALLNGQADLKNANAMIWTTTPWTLPASMAIAYHPKETYVLAREVATGDLIIVAKALLPKKAELVRELGTGAVLQGLEAKHPFIDRDVPLLPGEHVTMDTGTGLVHTAPGHGEEDFELGMKFGIDAYSPVEGNGRFEADVAHFAGLKVFEANHPIIDLLKSLGRLFGASQEIEHSYPHCWRCKNPVIFRATAQWFASLAHRDLRKTTLEEIDRIQWVPSWGRDRIYGMIENRPDWCLSRQRVWGIPIVAFRCKDCGEYLLSADIIRKVADQFEKEGADVWFAKNIDELTGQLPKCAKCGNLNFEKGKDILDVWFDSGCSHAAVLEKREELGWPADLYLEGSDQHRGWFHSSLLEGIATRGRSPYKSVVTHGFVVDGDGRKMSKSLGNYVSAQDLMKEKGAEMMRLWVATEDYRNDVRFSNEIMERVIESYRRIRNTARFCLGNLFDFNPEKDAVAPEKFAREIDQYILGRLQKLVARVEKAFADFEFHIVVSALNEFCVVDFSSLYLDVSKDTLYCDLPNGADRRSAQTVLFETAKVMSLMLAPILPFTSEEIWSHLPTFEGKETSIHLARYPELQWKTSSSMEKKWERLLELRSEVSKALETLRKEKALGQSLQAKVEVVVNAEDRKLLQSMGKELARLWIVSRALVVDRLSKESKPFEALEKGGMSIGVQVIGDARCERCWTYSEDVGGDSSFPTLCKRCIEVVR